jgi:outer membrane protein TolC
MRGLTLLLLLSSLHGISQQRVSMSLQECIEYALKNNEDVQNARLENEIARTEIDETLSQGLPQVNGNIGVTNNLDIQVNPFPDFISPGVYDVLVEENLIAPEDRPSEFGIVPAAFGTNWTVIAGVSASQLIFDGSFFVGLEASRTLKLLREKEQVRTEVDIVEAVSKAYYLVLISKENLEFLGRNFQTVDTLLIETEAMYNNGFAEKIDVSRIKIRHNNLKTNLKNSTELLATSLNLLKFQMGMPLGFNLQLTDELSSINLNEAILVDSARAIYRRPEYEILQTNKTLVDLNIKNFNSLYLPNLYASFNMGWTSGTNTFQELTTFDDQTWFRYTNIGLNLSIPIFDGLYKSSNIQRSRIQKKQLETTVSQLENNIKREVEEAIIKHENALREIASQRENLELSAEIYNTTRIKYQEGVGSNIEVINTITDYEEARNNYLSALYGAATAQIELKKALGTLN